jgi:hypothetical protein
MARWLVPLINIHINTKNKHSHQHKKQRVQVNQAKQTQRPILVMNHENN